MDPKQFIYSMPTKVVHGPGTIMMLGQEAKAIGAKKIFLVMDPGIKKAGLHESALRSLNQAGLETIIFSDVEEDPAVETIEAGRKAAQGAGADLIVALGGGSVICAAKAIAIVLTNGGLINSYEGSGKVAKAPVPVIAIPTTAGSGSEVSAATMITDAQRKVKMNISSPMGYPRVAILDPELLLSLPFRQAVLSGVDALSHAIEAYTSTIATPITDCLALSSIEMLFSSLRESAGGWDISAKETNLIASAMANMACGNARLGLVHEMSKHVSGLFKVSHGLANGTLLPYVMEYNMKACPGRFSRMALHMGEHITDAISVRQLAQRSITSVKRLLADLDFPRKFSPEQVDRSAIPEMADRTMAGALVKFNARKPSRDDVMRLYEQSFLGWEIE